MTKINLKHCFERFSLSSIRQRFVQQFTFKNNSFYTPGSILSKLHLYRNVTRIDHLQGIFCLSLVTAPFQIQNSLFFSQCHVCFFPIKESEKNIYIFFFPFSRDHYYLLETMTHIRMILKHLCLSGMLGIIQSKIT